MTGDAHEAEELAQEVFLVAIDRWDRFQGRSAESTWLYGILMKLHQKRARTLRRLHRRLRDYAAAATANGHAEPDPRSLLAVQQWRQSVWAMVARLPLDQQQAITLRFGEEMSYQQIADALGCKLGTAKTRVHHGLKRLRQQDAEPVIAPATSSSRQRTPAKTNDCYVPLRYRPTL